LRKERYVSGRKGVPKAEEKVELWERIQGA